MRLKALVRAIRFEPAPCVSGRGLPCLVQQAPSDDLLLQI
jgi:hypothetical protein